jgi:hypothetical protein
MPENGLDACSGAKYERFPVLDARAGRIRHASSRARYCWYAWAARTGPPMQHSSSTNARHAWQVGSGVGVPWVGDPVPP